MLGKEVSLYISLVAPVHMSPNTESANEEIRTFGADELKWSSLAYLEMRMVLAKLFWKYDLSWFNSQDVDWERDSKGYTLWEKPELRCTLQERMM